MNQRQWRLSVSAFILFIIGALLVAAGLVVVLKVFPKVLINGVNSQKVLGLNKDGTWNAFTKTWAYPTYISTMNYWTFDYRNPIGIVNRAMYPDMNEKGPYTYDEIITNDHIAFSDDGETMVFAQAQTFIFNKKKSCPTCDPLKDKITIPDISFAVGMQLLDNILMQFFNDLPSICNKIPSILQNICHGIHLGGVEKLILAELGTITDFFKTAPFVEVTVDQLLFSGYKAPFIDKFVNGIINILNLAIGTQYFAPVNATLVSLNPTNATTDQLYNVSTGSLNPDQAGYIKSFSSLYGLSEPSNGQNVPSDWWPSAGQGNCKGANGEYALKIDGTNADFFKSNIQTTDVLPVFISDICRTAYLNYEKKVKVMGITGFRYILPKSQFDWTDPKNCGFCSNLTYGAYNLPANSPCLPNGVLNIAGCQQGLPIAITKPHFYQAADIVQQFVPRFKGSYENDETTLDIEPITGTVLEANKRLQINFIMNQFSNINSLKVLRPGAYPLVRLNESFIMDEGTHDTLQSSVFVPKKIITIICWTAVGLGGFLMALSGLLLLVAFCCVREKDEKDE